ncbi:anaerobic ribonucleoside-triphosphate reductase-activating protein [Sansalvadorimonas sp. 2012CJ34-2]|uniref:Anaerobic ribonucleoside-triphosphate reductase-activating protein n=1 Tax=Parendozoicomonas callyspongiae TaxID=2942213 RepID=A0ABT0PJ94_9GAMM|nr:anaerobic ribonucleoside-triphosphate reductase-activating protein [Sansalvadorimonas sp. 2012CJ34-2]MCL6271403.1 anaerobic ribonucleoside-triphosphate reductase-activating protein [Sansalvadorimonas sp. 2012CJ34-2]
MNYHNYYSLDVVNGEGTRCTLFVSGCEHKCVGCHNASTIKPESGHPYTQELEDQIIKDLGDSRIHRDGLSLSGGDPLYPGNLDDIGRLVRRVKEAYPDKNIWLWTGYIQEKLSERQKEIVQYVDVLIDGPYVQTERDLTLPWRGSRNQRMIYMLAEH